MSPAERADGHERDGAMEPRIYVASLSDYNAGRLHGAWISAAQSPDEVHEGIATMLTASPEPGAEEYAIHDFENFGTIRLSEYESIEVVAAIAAGIAEYGEAFTAWAVTLDSLDLATSDAFHEAYQGQWRSRRDFTDEMLDDWGIDLNEIVTVPESLRPYLTLDMEAWLRDCEIGGGLVVVEHSAGIWVFFP